MFKHLLGAGAGCALLYVSSAAAQAISVGATISGQVVPGVYGQVVIGDRPPPPLVYATPVVVAPAPVALTAPPEPIYLHVPPGHARNWHRHCAEYNACNRPVYFVRSAEYDADYRPHGEHRHEHAEDYRGHDHGERQERHEGREGHERHEGHDRDD
ncbi:MAG: hypothetical protein JOZ03_11670 [Gammaproteobacteria bacterium]|nr:hypothetical protein [Gammaproteobacteria bacterium]